MNDSPTVGVLIRFSNSRRTLPAVIEAIKGQSRLPDKILGVDSHSSDGSTQFLIQAGADVVQWDQPYHHSKVLNYGMSKIETDLVLILSSHTVLESSDCIAKLVACFEDPDVSCASPVWDDDPFYSQAVEWNELESKGLRFGSIYTNSIGMIRHRAWKEIPFDERLDSSEDYAWAIERLKKGDVCRRLALPFSHQRGGARRDYEFAKAVFQLASSHRLPVAWMGCVSSMRFLLKGWINFQKKSEWLPVWDRLMARVVRPF